MDGPDIEDRPAAAPDSTPADTVCETERWTRELPVADDFAAALAASAARPLPDDWFVAVTDVTDSRAAIAEGRYKSVNLAGVAMIAAAMNRLGTREIPYIFGGDGAALAIAPAEREATAEALALTVTFAAEELRLSLRAGLIPVARLREGGADVRVQAVRLSEAVHNFAFTGGGLALAERLLKAGEYALTPAPPDSRPDLTGLSCRWTPLRSKDRSIVSLIVEPGADVAPARFAVAVRDLAARLGMSGSGGSPIPPEGPGVAWPPEGLELEARASRKGGSLLLRRLALLAETALAYAVLKAGRRLGSFDPLRYRRMTGLNTDFRKVQDGLRLTLSLTGAEIAALEEWLGRQKQRGLLRYGFSVQDSALITCFVRSINDDSHLHFLDGADGGYAKAASMLRDAG